MENIPLAFVRAIMLELGAVPPHDFPLRACLPYPQMPKMSAQDCDGAMQFLIREKLIAGEFYGYLPDSFRQIHTFMVLEITPKGVLFLEAFGDRATWNRVQMHARHQRIPLTMDSALKIAAEGNFRRERREN